MDLTTIIVIGVIVLLVAYLINRNQAKPNNRQQGTERPTYDDPNIQGRGSFGRDRGNQNSTERPTYDDPNIQGHGSFGRDRGTSTPMNNQLDTSTGDATKPNVITHQGNNDPNVSGQGGFGRNK